MRFDGKNLWQIIPETAQNKDMKVQYRAATGKSDAERSFKARGDDII